MKVEKKRFDAALRRLLRTPAVPMKDLKRQKAGATVKSMTGRKKAKS